MRENKRKKPHLICKRETRSGLLRNNLVYTNKRGNRIDQFFLVSDCKVIFWQSTRVLLKKYNRISETVSRWHKYTSDRPQMKTNYKFIWISECLYQNCQFRYEKKQEKDFYINEMDIDAADGLFHSARHSGNVLCLCKIYATLLDLLIKVSAKIM